MATADEMAEINQWISARVTKAFGNSNRYWAWRKGLDSMLQECGAKQTAGWGHSSRADAQYLVYHGIEPDRIKALYALCFL